MYATAPTLKHPLTGLHCKHRIALLSLNRYCLQLCSTYTEVKVSKRIVIRKLMEDIDDKTRPIALVLGWGNSRHRYLKKYAELLGKNGFDTVMVTNTLFDAILFPETKSKKLAKEVLDAIQNHYSEDASPRPILLYPFSNGGCAVYYFICNTLCDKSYKFYGSFRIVGTIFDSCPVNPNMESIPIVQKAFTDRVKNPLLKAVMWYSLRLAVPFVVWLNPVVKVFMHELENSPISSPQLFLYSKADSLAPWHDIEQVANYRQKLGITIKIKDFDDSPHVGHYKQYPKEYEKIVDNFLEAVKVDCGS